MKKRKIKSGRLAVLLILVFGVGFFVFRGFFDLLAAFKKNDAEDLADNSDKLVRYSVSIPASHTSNFTVDNKYIPISPNFLDTSTVAGNDIESKYAILVCTDDESVISSKNSSVRMYPASMTKIMTLIVAVENIENFYDEYTMSYEVINPLVEQQATRTGLESGETVTILDLLYGIILPSGADACVSVALYVSGSEEAFVTLMNEKAEELGLDGTHFTNTSGLHDAEHYTTAYDMAVIMDCAMNNELCRKILSAEEYTTTSTVQHPEGLLLKSTMFERVSKDGIDGVDIVGGKTGYTVQSGHCLASLAVKNGKTYIAVIGGGTSRYTPVYDTLKFFEEYI